MSTEYLIKAPGEDRRCVIDWPGLRPGEALAESLGWTVTPREADADALVLREAEAGDGRSAVVAAGGRPGHVYHVSHRVRTSEGRAVSRAFLLRVVER
ncbi:hypothetical protein ACQ5SO_05840 [Rhodovulum sp. DZ06]|uniref:phage fiber-tail adaptor protein n=1 Tax=Rhodovulum sp. DZ06 TaxID=3425126 RepID=UPI003D352314